METKTLEKITEVMVSVATAVATVTDMLRNETGKDKYESYEPLGVDELVEQTLKPNLLYERLKTGDTAEALITAAIAIAEAISEVGDKVAKAIADKDKVHGVPWRTSPPKKENVPGLCYDDIRGRGADGKFYRRKTWPKGVRVFMSAFGKMKVRIDGFAKDQEFSSGSRDRETSDWEECT